MPDYILPPDMQTDVDTRAQLPREIQGPLAQSRVQAVGSVAPGDAASAIRNGPAAGVEPDVAMHMPSDVMTTADAARQQQAINTYPHVAAFAARAPDSYVAASKDSLPQMGIIGKVGAWFDEQNTLIKNDITSSFAAFNNKLSQEFSADSLKKELQEKNFFKQEAGNLTRLWDVATGISQATIGPLVQGYLAGPVVRALDELPLMPGEDKDKQHAANVQAVARMVKYGGLAVAPAEEGGFSIPETDIPGSNVGPVAKGPPPSGPKLLEDLRVPFQGVHAQEPLVPSEWWREAEPGTLPRQADLPPPGTDPVSDSFHIAKAQADVMEIQKLEPMVLNSPNFARSPEVMEDYLNNDVMKGQTITLGVEGLYDAIKGNSVGGSLFDMRSEEFSNLPDLHKTIKDGMVHEGSVTIPLGSFIAGFAGKPWFASLLASSVIGDNPGSANDLEETSKTSPVIADEAGKPVYETPHPAAPAPQYDEAVKAAQQTHDLAPGEMAQLQEQVPQLQQLAKEATPLFIKQLFETPQATDMVMPEFKSYSAKLEAAQKELHQKLLDTAVAQIKKYRTEQWRQAYKAHYEHNLQVLMGDPAVKALKSIADAAIEGSANDPYAKALAETAFKDADGKPTTFYHGSKTWNVGTPENPWKPIKYPVISFSTEPKFVIDWISAGDFNPDNPHEELRVFYIAHLLAKHPADFRKEADVQKAYKWYKENESWRIKNAGSDAAFIELLHNGNWVLWENPQMWAGAGFDATFMKENKYGPLNAAVDSGDKIVFKYRPEAVNNGVPVDKLSPETAADYAPIFAKYGVKLPKEMMAANGKSADEVADQFGYASGADMLEDIANVLKEKGKKSINNWIISKVEETARTQAEAALGFGRKQDMDELRQIAYSAVASPKATDLLIDELKTIGEATGLPFSEMEMRKLAEDSFDFLAVKRAAKYKQFENLLFGSARRAQRALAKGDFISAFKAKQEQFRYSVMLGKSHDLVTFMRRELPKLERYAGEATHKDVRQDFMNQAHQALLMLAYDVKRDPTDLEEQLDGESVLQFIDRMNAQGEELFDGGITAKALEKQPVWQFMNSVNTVLSLVHVGRKMGMIDAFNRKLSFESTVNEGLQFLAAQPRTLTHLEQKSPQGFQKVDQWRREVDAWLVRPEQLFLDFGAHLPDNIFNQVVTFRMQDRKGWLDDNRLKVAQHLHDLTKSLGKGWQRWLKQKLPASGPNIRNQHGEPILQSNADIVAAMLNWGNASNIYKLTEGYGTTPDEFRKVIDEYATEDAWKYVQSMWDLMEGYWPEIAAMYRRMAGVAPPKIISQPVETKWGTLRGGYMPVIYDYDKLPQSIRAKMAPKGVLGDDFYFRATPDNRYTKQRTGFAAPIDLNMELLPQRLEQVLYDLAFREALIDANRFLTDGRMTEMVARKYGPEYNSTIRNWIRRVAANASFDPTDFKRGKQLYDSVLRNTLVHLIGYSFHTVAVHAVPALVSSIEDAGDGKFATGAVKIADALRQLGMHPQAKIKEIMAESQEIRHRMLNTNEEVRNAYITLVRKQGPLSALQRHAFDMVGWSDLFSALPLYIAAKDTALNAGYSELEAIKIADQRVRQAHGSAGVVDAPAALAHGRNFAGAVMHSLSLLNTVFNHMYNRSREIPQSLLGAPGGLPPIPPGQEPPDNMFFDSNGDPFGDRTRPGKALSLTIAMILAAGITEELFSRHKHKDFMKAIALFPTKFIPIIGPEIADFLEGGAEDVGNSTPIAAAAKNLGVFAADIIEEGVRHVRHQGHAHVDKKIGTDAAMAAGPVLGVPGLQPTKTVKYLESPEARRDKEHRDLMAIVAGLTLGPEKKGAKK